MCSSYSTLYLSSACWILTLALKVQLRLLGMSTVLQVFGYKANSVMRIKTELLWTVITNRHEQKHTLTSAVCWFLDWYPGCREHLQWNITGYWNQVCRCVKEVCVCVFAIAWMDNLFCQMHAQAHTHTQISRTLEQSAFIWLSLNDSFMQPTCPCCWKIWLKFIVLIWTFKFNTYTTQQRQGEETEGTTREH